jgi:hypothetical protein
MTVFQFNFYFSFLLKDKWGNGEIFPPDPKVSGWRGEGEVPLENFGVWGGFFPHFPIFPHF